MPTSKTMFLATAAALALGWGLLGPGLTVGQDADRKPEERKPPRQEERPTLPPRNLKLVGDHWTPYNPPDPESFPPDATLHIIVRGETLWGMADLTYNNPYLWPQLWDANRYILDSHWIYPGDPLLLPPRPVVVSEGTGATIVPQGQEGAPATSLEPMPDGALQEPLAAESPTTKAPAADESGRSRPYHERDLPLVDESDIRCAGFIVESGKRNELFIAENEEPGFDGITTGTLVYLNRGADDARLQPGSEFNIVEREGKVLHPVSEKAQGYYVRRLGELRVLKVLADTAIAAVTFACDEIRVGNELVAIEHQQVPSRPVPAFDRLRLERNGKAIGYVIHATDTVVRSATGDLVSIDLGSEDGLNPGDFLTAFEPMKRGKRPHQSAYHFQYNNEVFESADLHFDDGREEFPAKPVGQMVVVNTANHTSTVKIIHSIAEVHVGTMVEVD